MGVLEVLRHREDHPEHDEEDEGDRARCGRELRVAEEAEVEHRFGRVHLPPREREQDDDRDSGGQHRRTRQPTALSRDAKAVRVPETARPTL